MYLYNIFCRLKLVIRHYYKLNKLQLIVAPTTGYFKKNATPIFLHISHRINATFLCFKWAEIGGPFVLHIETFKRDKRFLKYLQKSCLKANLEVFIYWIIYRYMIL